MEPTRRPKGLRYESILSHMDVLEGAKELARLAAGIASDLKSSHADRRDKAN